MTVDEPPLAALVLIQPKNTATPLLLCGARLLSASGLSNDEHRLVLLKSIVEWAWGWQPIPATTPKELSKPAQLEESTLNMVCIVLAGTSLNVPKEIISLASALFAIELSEADLQLAFQRLSEYGLAQVDGENLHVNMDALETYTQQKELWAYVRVLRKDFERKQLL